MLRLKYLAAICALALTVGAAQASTFQVSGEWDSFDGHINPFYTGAPIDMSKFPLPMRLGGTLDFTGGALTALNITVGPEGGVFNNPNTTATAPGFPGVTIGSSFIDNQNWMVVIHSRTPGSTDVYQIDLTLADVAGTLIAALYEVAQPGMPAYDSFIGNFTDWHGSAREVPLPAALPLFATGLGALGLLGWRRKRKAV